MQHTVARARQLTEQIYIVSEESHIEHVREQLAELPPEAFIVEPGRRGTANCIVTALAQIGQRHDPLEAVAFVHADHYIRDEAGFAHSFRVAGEVSSAQNRLVLVGVEPDHPATGFGYIEKGDLLSDEPFVFNVRSFKEKPDFDTAQMYMQSGKYLWNGGYFIASLQTFAATMQAHAPELFANYEKLRLAEGEDYRQTYLDFETAAIDYALIEKVPDLLVVPASFDWMDLGSFADLAKAVGSDEIGNHVYGPNVQVEEVQNSLIQNFEDKPVAVIGLDNCVVVNTPHGLLVTRKDMSQKIGDVSKRFTA